MVGPLSVGAGEVASPLVGPALGPISPVRIVVASNEVGEGVETRPIGKAFDLSDVDLELRPVRDPVLSRVSLRLPSSVVLASDVLPGSVLILGDHGPLHRSTASFFRSTQTSSSTAPGYGSRFIISASSSLKSAGMFAPPKARTNALAYVAEPSAFSGASSDVSEKRAAISAQVPGFSDSPRS